MVLPPPPLLFRPQHHRHQYLRYGNVLHPPDFIAPPNTHHFPPLPPPQARQSLIFLPPPSPPPRHIAQPPLAPHFSFSPPCHQILDRSHLYEVDLPPKPYLHRNYFPPPSPPPPPETRENIHLRLVHDYSERNPILEDEIIRQGRSDRFINELAESRDRQVHCGAREFHSRVPDIGYHERYGDKFCRSRELYNNRDDAERRWDNGINYEREYGEKRLSSVMNRGRELYKRDYDETRQGSINGWIHGIYKDRNHDARRSGSGISDRSCKLYCGGVDDERRLNYSTTGNAVFLGLENRRPEFVENVSSLGRFSGRIGSGVSEKESVRSKKKRRLQKNIAISSIESGKDCSEDNGGKYQHLTEESSGRSFKGKEKEGFECLQTRMDGKRERKESLDLAISFKSNALVAKAILAPPCPAVKTDISSAIVKTGLTSSMPGLPAAKSSEDVVTTDLVACGLDLQSDSLGTSKELLDKAVVSKSGSVADDVTDLGEIAVRNQPQKDMNLQSPTVVESGSARRNRLRKKRKARKKLLHETCMQMTKDSVNNANDCIIPSASPQPRSDANGLGEIAAKNQPEKEMNLQGPTVIGFGSTRPKKRKSREKLLHETSMQMRNNANDCILPSASPQPCFDANDLGEIAVKKQLQKNMNLQGPAVVESGSTRRKKRKAIKKLLHEASMQTRKDSGHITNANDCIIPSAFPQPCSDAKDSGEVLVKNQPQKDMNLEVLTVVGAGSTRRNRVRKKRKAKKLLHESSMQLRKDSGHIINTNDCIIPSASPQPCSGANDLGEIAVKNQPQKDMSSEGPTVVGSESTRRKKRKARKEFFYETSMQMRRDRDHIICITPSAPLQPISDATVSKTNLSTIFTGVVPNAVLPPTFGGIVSEKADANGDSCKPSVPNLKRKRSFTTLSASPYVADSLTPACSGHAERLVTSTEDAEVEHFEHGTYLANESTCPGDSLGFNQHGNNVDNVVQNEVSVFDTKKSKIESVEQYAKLGADSADDISEHPFHDGLPLMENSFVNGPSKSMVSLEGNDMVDSSQEDRCSSEIHASNASSESDSALPIKLIISDVGSADANSKEVFPNKLNTPQVLVDSEEFRSLEGVTVLNCSNATSTNTDCHEANHNEIIFDVFSPNVLSKKPSNNDIGSVEGSLDEISNAKTCLSVDYSSNTRKKEARDAQTGFLDTNVAFSTSISGEVGLLAKDLVPSMEIDFLGEKGSSKEVDESPSRVENPTLELGFDANGLFRSYSKKRKVANPRSNLSSYLEDDMVAGVLNSDCSKHYQGSTGVVEMEAVKRDDTSFSRNTEGSACQSEHEMVFGGENICNGKPVSPDRNLFLSGKPLEKAVSVNSQISAELSRPLPEVNSEIVKKLNLAHGNQTLSKNQWTSASPKVFPGRHPLYFSNSRKLQSTNVANSRTWRRNGNSSMAAAEIKLQPSPLPQCHGMKTARTIQSSYIRKGNSLVRNPSPSAVTSGFHNSSCSVYRLNPCTNNLKNNQASDSDAQSIMRTDQVNTSKMPCKTIDALEECIKSPGVPECRDDLGNSSNSQSICEEGNPEKKIMYVKRRSNQLIAASNSDDKAIFGVDKSQASSSDGYYKRKKNQLVRDSSENNAKKRDENGNLCRLLSRTILPRTCTRRPSGTAKRSRLSFVWKLPGMQSSEKNKTSAGPQKVLPHLFPRKRTLNWRSFIHARSTKPYKSSFSITSQTLLVPRKRGAIYTRSTRGYSLRMSKVLSVGGSNLKWSKSIERNSKKANEEATQAVAAAEKRKKEENGAVPIASKSRNNVSRERIFRIGSERYKMDSSRGTLHRITEQEPPSSAVLQSEKNVKRSSYVPRRLLIGNEEYVRIGNGNQLVRDPKKRTRVLASEKIRWSLRTARLRLARKRKYCQFFTRFGKCNKDDGKCPYIHDPSKIAVCTKFLNGLCTNVDCKLTHKVIPERMEDCSYFLKGSCSNENCPYRHVNVNPKSAVCKNFLRGHCADGNGCRKKHTYVCPAFEANGFCPKASTCKLHHPKKKIEKQQPSSEQKTVLGRYFDGGLIGDDDDVTGTSSGKVSAKGKDDLVFHDGNFPEYISLDVSDDEVDETLASDEVCDDILSDEQMDDFDFDVLV